MKPKITYTLHSNLFNAMDTIRICDEQIELEKQLQTTTLAAKMLEEIGVKLK